MEKKTRLTAGALLVLGTLAGAVVLAVTLEKTLAYRSPLEGPDPPATPRQQALRALEEAVRQKAEEAARRAELLANLTPETMVELGREIVHGRGLCFNCHRIGDEGTGILGPNLEGVGARAGERVAGLSDVDYLAQSLYEPGAFIVPGYTPAMTPATEAPIGLSDDDILFVIAYLQSKGGTPSIGPDTQIHFGGR